MDILREIVSGPKNRYRKDGYNLDLTYIFPRLIAMAYPAEGIQKLYRNSVESVADFLGKNHQNNYQIINVSGREINGEILANVHSFYWEDHKTPELHIIFQICGLMLDHLISSPEKVCVVHCNHGKGRTGTLICCFLLFINYFSTPREAMEFYAKRRFEEEGYGVTQPCQIKYIEYFHQLMKSPQLYPSVVCISKIQINGAHELKQPYFKLRGVSKNNCIFNTNKEEFKVLKIEKNQELTVKIRESPFFIGDVILDVKNQGLIKKKMAASYTFNTAFLDSSSSFSVPVNLKQLSPLSATKSGVFNPNFEVKIYFKRLCKCNEKNQINVRCEKCSPYMKTKDVLAWDQICQILKKKQKIDPSWVLKGSKEQAKSNE